MSARVSIRRTGSIGVPMAADLAMPLFTPEGERLWEPGWAPTYPVGGVPPLASGVVFRNHDGTHESTWVVARWEPEALRASYSYVVPGHRATLVEVGLEATGPGRCRATATYHMTALSEAGDAAVRRFDEGFDAFLAGWEERLSALAGTPGTAPAALVR